MEHIFGEFVTPDKARRLYDRALGSLDCEGQRVAVVAVTDTRERPELPGQRSDNFDCVGPLDELMPKCGAVRDVLRDQRAFDGRLSILRCAAFRGSG